MKADIGTRVRQVREAENLSREAFSEATGVPFGTLRGIEGGKHEPSFAVIQKIATHERLKKYALWLIAGETNPAAGQVAPGETPKPGAAVDRELLELLIETVEQIMEDRGVNLPPEKKSKLITYLYEQYSQEQDIEISRPSVTRLIDFAA